MNMQEARKRANDDAAILQGWSVHSDPGAPAVIERQRLRCQAALSLVDNLQAQISHHREEHAKYSEAIQTLDSERKANAILTADVEQLRAENERLRAELKKAAARDAMFCDTIERGYLAMQAAWLEAEISSPANGMVWIHNTLCGPGLLPDADEARALGGAQAWFDRESAKLDKADAAREAKANAAEVAPAGATGGANG